MTDDHEVRAECPECRLLNRVWVRPDDPEPVVSCIRCGEVYDVEQ